MDFPLGTFVENRHWRAHHPFCQAHFQDILTGTAPPAGGRGLEEEPGGGQGLRTLVHTCRESNSQACQLPSVTS